ncbi:hypothetical protein BH11PSE7_BH11PSE7_06460 [soil metagenome]
MVDILHQVGIKAPIGAVYEVLIKRQGPAQP